jgi:hypothetical protein
MNRLAYLTLFVVLAEMSAGAAQATGAVAIVPLAGEAQVPQILELRSFDQQMGNQPPKSNLEGSLSVDGYQLFSVLAPELIHAQAPRLVPIEKPDATDLYLVRIDFTLHELERRAYQQVTLRVMLSDPGAEVIDLFPKQLAGLLDAPKTLLVTSAIELMGVGDRSGAIPLDDLRPVVRGYRDGRQGIYWIFNGLDGSYVSPGSRSVYYLLRVPRSANRISGSIAYEAKLELRWMYILWQRDAKTDNNGFTLALRPQQTPPRR